MLTEKDVTFTIETAYDLLPVEGNAIVSGDDDFDRKVENEIIDRLNNGDAWAWATVTVTAEWEGFTASEHLGGCSYKDENDFCQPGGYYDDMKAASLAELNEKIVKAKIAIDGIS